MITKAIGDRCGIDATMVYNVLKATMEEAVFRIHSGQASVMIPNICNLKVRPTVRRAQNMNPTDWNVYVHQMNPDFRRLLNATPLPDSVTVPIMERRKADLERMTQKVREKLGRINVQ